MIKKIYEFCTCVNVGQWGGIRVPNGGGWGGVSLKLLMKGYFSFFGA
jgi:hypothetical protein